MLKHIHLSVVTVAPGKTSLHSLGWALIYYPNPGVESWRVKRSAELKVLVHDQVISCSSLFGSIVYISGWWVLDW